jgi:uncharacterized protein YndB with AHSA1/START domain
METEAASRPKEEPQEFTLRIEWTFDAPRELVFKAWVDPLTQYSPTLE